MNGPGRVEAPRIGFTLIELLVVIAIIALLVSILTPSLQNAKELAQNSVCQTRLRGISNALAAYWMENDYNNPICRYNQDKDGNDLGWYERLYWPYGLWDKVGNNDQSDRTPAKWYETILDSEIFNCPAAFKKGIWSQPDHPRTHESARSGQEYTVSGSSYALNHWVSYPSVSRRYPKMNALQDPAATGMLLDAGKGLIYWRNNATYADHCPSCTNCLDPRHLGRMNSLMADGHVRSKPFSATLDADTGAYTQESWYIWYRDLEW